MQLEGFPITTKLITNQIKRYINQKANEFLNKAWLVMVEGFMNEKFEKNSKTKNILPIDYTDYEF